MMLSKLKRQRGMIWILLFGCFVYLLFPPSALAYHGNDKMPPPSFGDSLMEAGENLGDIIISDGSYFFRSLLEDGIGLFKLPAEENEITVKDVLKAGILVGSIPAMIYGLDKPIRHDLRGMNDGTADLFRNIGLGGTLGGLGLVYGWGVFSRNEEARHAVLTGVESMGVASLLGVGAKAAFGRNRPRDGGGPRAFFKGGESFPSGQSTLAFAAAAALSEGFNNRWWVAVPAYGFAIMTGVGRIGKDAHWASDIIASSLIGVGTSELLFYLHRKRDWPTSSLMVSPMVTERGVTGAILGITW